MPRKKQVETRRDSRALILNTALQLFTGRGYFNTSVQDIRRTADVSIGTIYHYFASKEKIATALYNELLAQMTQAVQEIIDQQTTTRDRFCALVSYLFVVTENSPEVMQYILYAKHREFLPTEKPICSSKPFEMILQMVKRGIENGEICCLDPVVATASLFGGAIRLIHLHLDGALGAPLSRYLEETCRCAWEAVTWGNTD